MKKGYELVMALDGEQALEMARTEALDLILMDISLPGLRRLGSHPAAQSQARNPGHPDYRPHRPCHGRRPGKMSGSRL